MGRDTGEGSIKEIRSDVHMRTLKGSWIMSHVNPSAWIRAVPWAVGRDLSPGYESVGLLGGRAGTTQGWLELGEAVLCFWGQAESQLRTGRTVGEEEGKAGRFQATDPFSSKWDSDSCLLSEA